MEPRAHGDDRGGLRHPRRRPGLVQPADPLQVALVQLADRAQEPGEELHLGSASATGRPRAVRVVDNPGGALPTNAPSRTMGRPRRQARTLQLEVDYSARWGRTNSVGRPTAARGTPRRGAGHAHVGLVTARCTATGRVPRRVEALSLLEQAGVDSNEHGWVLLAQAQAGGGLDVQKRLYEEAIATARRCRDGDLECEALASLGIMLAFSGPRRRRHGAPRRGAGRDLRR